MTYTFQTPERAYDIVPTSSNLIEVRAEDRDALEEMLNTIELVGAADGIDLSDIQIKRGDNGYDTYDYILLDPPTLALYFQGEVLNFMVAAK